MVEHIIQERGRGDKPIFGVPWWYKCKASISDEAFIAYEGRVVPPSSGWGVTDQNFIVPNINHDLCYNDDDDDFELGLYTV